MKVLILRFSSFGDIVQAMGIPTAIHGKFPAAEIHWAVRSDFADILIPHPEISKIWQLERRSRFLGLRQLIKQLRKENYTHIYDAHNNLRSRIITLLVHAPSFLRRSKNRWKRFLLFTFQKNLFPKPFVGQESYLRPLEKWGILGEVSNSPQFFISSAALEKAKTALGGLSTFIALVPATAWAMKNWPEEHWKNLIRLNPNIKFVILGGPQDVVCENIKSEFPDDGNVMNLAGNLSLLESAAVLSLARSVIAADTGLLHVADQLGTPSLALMGPTAFGFPARSSSKIIEVPLSCRPCTKDGRGTCSNVVYQKCMIEITPERVSKELLP